MSDRQEFTRKTKAEGFERSKGNCEICGAHLYAGKFRYDHRIPCALGGDNSLANLVVQCTACDAPKTANDVRMIRKADRQRDRHTGAMPKSKTPMPCGKGSKYKKTMSGKVVLR